MDLKHQSLLNWRVQKINELVNTEGHLPFPIQLDSYTVKTELPKLEFHNHDSHSSVMRLTNTGTTALITQKWSTVPYIRGGPLMDHYLCSQIHFHWGASDEERSLHRISDGVYPLEMHLVHYKEEYGCHEAALNKPDGMAVVVVFFQVVEQINPCLEFLVNRLRNVKKAGTATLIAPEPYEFLKPVLFINDYFMYWGSNETKEGRHPYMWLLSRQPIAIAANQIAKFRFLQDKDGEPIVSNWIPINHEIRHVYHVNPLKQVSTLLYPVFKECCPKLHFPGPSYFRSYWKGTNLKQMESRFQTVFEGNECPEQTHKDRSYFKKFEIPRQLQKNIGMWPLTYPQWPNDERMTAPIRFDTDIVEPLYLEPLTFHNYWQTCGSVLVENTGETVAIRPLYHRTPCLYGGPLVDVYELDNIHFHWATIGNAGGHVINDVANCMEVHCVHYLKRHWCLKNAARERFGVAVVAFPLSVTMQQENAEMEPLISVLKFVQCALTRKTISGPALEWLRPKASPHGYFSYMGHSSCTPPCCKPETWILYPRPIKIGYKQYEEFTDLRSDKGWMDYNADKATFVNDRLILFALDPLL